MITLNLKAILTDREIKNHTSFLFHNGFSWATASRMATGNVKALSFKHMEKLCLLLHCTPNDLLHWTADEGKPIERTQPIQQLVPPVHHAYIAHGLKHLPIDELRELRKIMEEEVKHRLQK